MVHRTYYSSFFSCCCQNLWIQIPRPELVEWNPRRQVYLVIERWSSFSQLGIALGLIWLLKSIRYFVFTCRSLRSFVVSRQLEIRVFQITSVTCNSNFGFWRGVKGFLGNRRLPIIFFLISHWWVPLRCKSLNWILPSSWLQPCSTGLYWAPSFWIELWPHFMLLWESRSWKSFDWDVKQSLVPRKCFLRKFRWLLWIHGMRWVRHNDLS